MKTRDLLVFALLLCGTITGLSQSPVIPHQEVDMELHQQIPGTDDVYNLSLLKGTAIPPTQTEEIGYTPGLDWSGLFGGTAFDHINDLYASPAGGFIIAGHFTGEITVGSETWVSNGGQDAFVAKFLNETDIEWAMHLPADPGGHSTAMAVTIDGGEQVHLCGGFSGTVDWDGNILSSSGSESMFHAIISPGGSLLSAWAVDQTGHYTRQADMDWNSNTGSIYTIAIIENEYGDGSVFLRHAYDGTLLAIQHHDEYFNSISVNDNQVLYAGEYNQGHDGTFPNSAAVLPPAETYQRAFIATSDHNGNVTWAYAPGHLNPFNGDSRASQAMFGNNDELLWSGEFRSNIIIGEDTIYSDNTASFLAADFPPGSYDDWILDLPEYRVHDFAQNASSEIYTLCPGSIAMVDGIGNTMPPGTVLWMEENTYGSHLLELGDPVLFPLVTAGNNNHGTSAVTFWDATATSAVNHYLEGNSGNASILALRTDRDGNIYTLGNVVGEADFFGTSISHGIFLAKQDPAGNVAWTQHLSDSNTETSNQGDFLHIDTVNQVLTTAFRIFDVFIIPGEVSHFPGDEHSIVVAQFNLDGDYLNSWQEDFAPRFSLEGVITDHSGNVLISALFEDTITIGGNDLGSHGAYDGCIVKYDPAGNVLWTVQAGGESMEYVTTISSDVNDNIFLTGEFTSENQIIGTTPYHMPEGDGNVILAKLDPAGGLLWVKSLAATHHDWRDAYCWPTGIQVGPEGTVYIKGSMGDSAYFDGIKLDSPYPGYNKFIVKTDNDGNVLWATPVFQYKENYNSYWYDYNQFDVDRGGNMYFGGQARDILELENGTRHLVSGPSDLYFAKCSSEGQIEWVKGIYGYESNSNPWINSVASSPDGSIIIGATLAGEFSLDQGTYHASNNNALIARLLPENFQQINYTRDLVQGWNWFSVNAIHPDMSPDNLLVTGIQEGDYIKNQTASATYYTATGWYGSLSELSPEEMYMIKVQGPDCSISYDGYPLDLLASPITLASGWNWVGYPRQYEMPLPQAMASLSLEYGDYIKNQLVSATYYDNYGWFGTMETMVPGDGYKFRKNTAEELVYPPEGPSGILSMKGARGISADKDLDPHMFQFNGSLTAQVWLDGSAVAEEGDRLLAYVSGELRGSASASWFEPTGCWIFPLMAYTNASEGENLEFKYFESSSGLSYACEETMVLFPDMVEADALHPFILNVNTATGIEDPAMLEVLSLEVFPNPSNGPVQIRYSLESAGDVRITAYDMMGRVVRELESSQMGKGSHRITWDISPYPAGTYIIEMESGDDIVKVKVVSTK